LKIIKITIKNFRSINNASIDITSINAIVGRNSAGKSCLLRALNAFFNYDEEEVFFERCDHNYTTKTKSSIEMHFKLDSDPHVPENLIHSDKIIIKTTFQVKGSKCNRKIFYKSSNKWIQNNDCINQIKDYIEFILIPPNRDASSLIRTQNNVFKLLVDLKMKEATESRDNYSKKFQTAIEYLNDHEFKKIADQATNEFLANKKVDIEIKFNKILTYQDFLSDVSISINEHGLSHSLYECGTGIQSLTIISLYHLYGKEKKKNIILGLEEPETNLHPQSQKELIHYFKDLVQDGNLHQLFFTTHSSELINEVEHTDVILFRKVKDEKRGFKSLVKRLPQDFFTRYDLKQYGYYQFHRYRNSDFFFSDFIVITESKTEVEIIQTFGKKDNKKYDTNGLSYLILDGKTKAPYAIHLLKELEIPFLLIIDKDFFCKYKNDSLEHSLSIKGFPVYTSTNFHDQSLIDKLIPNKDDQKSILKNINNNHNQVLNVLEKYNIISMRYCTELDLIQTKMAQDLFYKILNCSEDEQNIKSLLSKKKAIKKVENIVQVIEQINWNSMPRTYSRIRNFMNRINKQLL
jgi:predicted ATP-dependent endonuclease of OLD family